MRSFWRWLERDKVFAVLFSFILILGVILIALIWFALPTKNSNQVVVAPGNSSGSSRAATSVTPVLAATSASGLDNTTTVGSNSTEVVSATSTSTTTQPNPTQLAALPNQGQDPAPPPPTEFAAFTPVSGVSLQPATPTVK